MGDQLFVCKSLGEVGALRDSVLAAVRNCGYAVLRGLFDAAATEASRRAVYRYANAAKHRPTSGLTPMDVRQNVSKWSIGSKGAHDDIARFALVVYNPLFERDVFELHDTFERMIQVRDTIAGRKILDDAELLPERFNACRVQIYPAGGGFLGEHRDLRGEANLPLGIYVEALLLLSEKGIDYRVGGGFVKVNGAALDSEADTKRGDLIIYDASTVHGVRDIDPEVPFDARDLRGRAVAMATIYDNR